MSQSASANVTLVKNMELQLNRLVDQLKDLDDCKDELSPDEVDMIKTETLDQIKEFTETLDRINKGDVTLETKLSQMRSTIQKAISSSFNTAEMIKMFGEQSVSDLERQLEVLNKEFQLKKVNQEEFEKKKLEILTKLRDQGRSLSVEDQKFVDEKFQSQLVRIEGEDY